MAVMAPAGNAPPGAENTPTKLPRVLLGYVTGTNRGRFLGSLKRDGDRVRLRSLLWDQAFGASLIDWEGTVAGPAVKCRLRRAITAAPFSPLAGDLEVVFSEDGCEASGYWITELGNQGTFQAWRASRFWLPLLTAWRFFRRLTLGLRRPVAVVYVLFLLAVAGLDATQRIKLSPQALLLLCATIPLAFQRQMADFVRLLRSERVKKVGPIELELDQQAKVAAEPRALLTAGDADQRVDFLILDHLFVLPTKLFLLWLGKKNAVSWKEFDEVAARQHGVKDENLDATKWVLINSKCVSSDPESVKITERGKRYGEHLLSA